MGRGHTLSLDTFTLSSTNALYDSSTLFVSSCLYVRRSLRKNAHHDDMQKMPPLAKLIRERYGAGVRCTKPWWTRHTNVLLLSGVGGMELIAKFIYNAVGDAADAQHADDAFDTEVAVLRALPTWWGVRYFDAFIVRGLWYGRVVVTTALPSPTPWTLYDGGRDSDIAKELRRQVRWLHRHGIAHGDLVLKNVLLGGGAKVCIIDFEKSVRNAPAHMLRTDTEQLSRELQELKSTQGIAQLFGRKPMP